MPILNEEGSDSAIFDNCLEFLHLTGRSLPHAAMMMVPEPWTANETMSEEVKAFYEYHSTLMEPWDGPAAMAFTDGVRVAAILDRNGLRPSRYTVTTDGLVILSSETGVLMVPPEKNLKRDRLRPGRMLLIDTEAGRIIDDQELKRQMAGEKPYKTWLEENRIDLDELPVPTIPDGLRDGSGADDVREDLTFEQRQKAFGYTFEDIRSVLMPMAKDGIEPLGSMGNDTPLAVLSDQPQLLYNYFKQLFAQVTNPPIDAQRESIVTATETYIGSDGNLLDPQPENCRQIRIHYPLISNDELKKLRYISQPGFASADLSILMPA
jgi:glutamate synthase (ferredoxin)